MKTSELKGAALDWAVATVKALPIRYDPMGFGNTSEGGFWIWDQSQGLLRAVFQKIGRSYSPSTNWAQGGPLIEQHHIGFSFFGDWVATLEDPGDVREVHTSASGETHLIAAMRCLVASKLGAEVEIPEELQGIAQ